MPDYVFITTPESPGEGEAEVGSLSEALDLFNSYRTADGVETLVAYYAEKGRRLTVLIDNTQDYRTGECRIMDIYGITRSTAEWVARTVGTSLGPSLREY